MSRTDKKGWPLRARLKPPDYDGALKAAWSHHHDAEYYLKEAERHIVSLENYMVRVAKFRPKEPEKP